MDKRSLPYLLAIGAGFALWALTRKRGLSAAERRAGFWELYDRHRIYPGATLADVAAIAPRTGALGRMAAEIETAAGLTDNEEQIAGAFRQLRSRYELYWLNRTFSYLFPNPAQAPQLGAWLDARLNDDEWIPIIRTLSTLPKFSRGVNGCQHTVCGICGGVAYTIHGAACENGKCISARGSICECRCRGLGHGGRGWTGRKASKAQQLQIFQ